MKSDYKQPNIKSRLKLVAGSKPLMMAGGKKPDPSMQPGKFVATVQTAKFIERGKKTNAVLIYEVAEGPEAGTQLRQWIEINEVNGVINPYSKYYEHCEMALGRPIKRQESLDPEQIFPGKLYVIEVGYSKRFDRNQGDHLALTKKYDRDFLRVHQILEVL
jgi:hypothetical protein